MSKSTKVDVQEDEEQEKFNEIVNLLLAAGYFRARIKGLSPFDKVIGGMTWCIEVCNIDIDVDLLFQENLNIGQKIALTEKIVAVLPKMKCPHQIEPHQIQGLDFVHIYPVIQWLVKRAIETRETTGDFIRAYSIYQFHKSYEMFEDVAGGLRKKKMAKSYEELKDVYRPQRLYRHHAPHLLREEGVRVQTTLLEYGKKSGIQIIDSKESNDSSGDETKLQKATDEEVKLTASQVGSIVGLQSSEIRQVASEFAEKQAELAHEESGPAGSQHHQRTLASLTKQVLERETELEEVNKNSKRLKGSYEEFQTNLADLRKNRNAIKKETELLDEAVTKDNKGQLETLRGLVSANESLKAQEQAFRAHCREEAAALRSQTEELRRNDSAAAEDSEYREAVEKQHKADKEKLQRARVLLARKNREIATLWRHFDEVPSRAELSQYQKRFVELYNQVAAKHKETKQFYTLYNTLEDSRLYISKEVDLLNSIQENFTDAMSSLAAKGEFLEQLEQIVERILQNKAKVEKKKLDEKRQRDALSDQLLDLVDKQRSYFKTVKDFTEECKKNEVLVAKLKEKNRTHGGTGC